MTGKISFTQTLVQSGYTSINLVITYIRKKVSQECRKIRYLLNFYDVYWAFQHQQSFVTHIRTF